MWALFVLVLIEHERSMIAWLKSETAERVYAA